MDSSGDSKVAVFRARQLLKEKRYADALQVCTDELARGTDDLQLRLIAAHSLLAQGRHEGAKKEAQLVIRLDPDQAEAYRILADIACTRGEMATACEHLERVLDLEPTDAKSKSLLETLSRPSSLPIPEPEPSSDPDTVPLPPGVQHKLKATSLDRFIEDTGPVELSDDDLIEEDVEEEDPTVANDGVPPVEEALFGSHPPLGQPEDDPHVDPFSGELFQVTDSMMEELPDKPEPQIEIKSEEPPTPGLATETGMSLPKDDDAFDEEPTRAIDEAAPPQASIADDWGASQPKPASGPKGMDAGGGKSVKYQATLRLPALDELPDDEDAPTMPLLRPTAPPAPQLKLDPKASKPVSHEKAKAAHPAAPKLTAAPPLGDDDSGFEDFSVEPASVPMAQPEPKPIPRQTLDPVKAQHTMKRKPKPPSDEPPDPFDLMTGAAGAEDEEPSLPEGRPATDHPPIAAIPSEVSGNLMGMLAGGNAEAPSSPAPSRNLPDSGGFGALPDSGGFGAIPEPEMGGGSEPYEDDMESQLRAAGLADDAPGRKKHTFRWVLVALIGLILGGGGLGGYLWYRSYKYVQGEWQKVRDNVHLSTPTGYRNARKAAERIIEHRRSDPGASAAVAMCEAAMSIEFGEDRLKQAREGLDKSKGTESEWRTAASAFLSLIDDPATAVGYLQKSLEVYPDSALLNYLKGRALAGSGSPDKAAVSYQVAIKLVPKYVAAKIALSVLLGQQETGYDEAVSSLDTILQSNPNNLQALIERARLKARHGKDLDGAAGDAQRVTGELNDKAGRGQTGWAQLVLAQVSRQKKTFTSMSTALDEAIKSPPPSDSFFAYELAGELMFLYRRADAFHQMKGALELKAKQPEYLQRMARVLLDLDDPRMADSYLKAAPARQLETRLLMGRQAYAQRKYSRAIDLLKRVVAEKNDHVEGGIYLALAKARKKQITAGTSELEKLAKANPGDHRIQLAKAQVGLWSGNLKMTHGALKTAWGITKLDPLAQTLSGHMSYRKHDLLKAEKRYQRALATRPEYRPARVGLARVLLRRGLVAEAGKQLGQIAEIDRKKPDVFGMSARIEMAGGKLEAARASIAQAESVGAASATVHRLNGELALAAKQGSTAVQQIQAAIKAGATKDAELMTLLARSQVAARKVDDAYDTFHQALKLDEGHPQVLLGLGRIATRDGEYGIAIKRFNDALKQITARQQPNSMKAEAHAAMGRAYLKKGDTGRSITNLQDAMDLDAQAAEPYYVMGLTYDRLDRAKRSVGYYEKAIQLDPSLIDAYERLGRAYGKLGNGAAALKYYQAFLNRNPPAAAASRVTREMKRLQGE